MVKHYVAVAVLVAVVTIVASLAIGGVDNILPTRASEEGVWVDRMFGIELQLIIFVFALKTARISRAMRHWRSSGRSSLWVL
jgi:hypothetical protein